jgi:hypothetical protein
VHAHSLAGVALQAEHDLLGRLGLATWEGEVWGGGRTTVRMVVPEPRDVLLRRRLLPKAHLVTVGDAQ